MASTMASTVTTQYFYTPHATKSFRTNMQNVVIKKAFACEITFSIGDQEYRAYYNCGYWDINHVNCTRKLFGPSCKKCPKISHDKSTQELNIKFIDESDIPQFINIAVPDMNPILCQNTIIGRTTSLPSSVEVVLYQPGLIVFKYDATPFAAIKGSNGWVSNHAMCINLSKGLPICFMFGVSDFVEFDIPTAPVEIAKSVGEQ